jgi:hypothetical protein
MPNATKNIQSIVARRENLKGVREEIDQEFAEAHVALDQFAEHFRIDKAAAILAAVRIGVGLDPAVVTEIDANGKLIFDDR